MRELFPEIEPYKTEFLDVGSGHSIYIEESGNPLGQPVLLLHGSGSGTSARNRRYYNPEKIRLISFHQRGIGKSKFTDYLKDNTTQDLINDIEKIRQHLQIEKLHVSGGSWGSTLALVYAEAYPERVLSLNLRAIYLGQKEDNDWIYSFGANQVFPDRYEALARFCEENSIEMTSKAFLEFVTTDANKMTLAKLISDFEGSILKLIPDIASFSRPIDEQTLRGVTIMLHLAANESFLKPNQLVAEIDKIRHIPAVIIHGRYDIVCPLIQAWKLHKAWPEAEFVIVPDAGHHHSDPGQSEQIMNYSDKFASLAQTL